MRLVSTRSLIAAAAAGIFAVTVLAADAPAPSAPRTEEVRVQNVIVRESGDSSAVSGQSIFIKHREVSGESPTTELTIINAAGQPEIFDAGNLAIGETKSFRTSEGKSVEVTRSDAGLILVVDGKSIVLPDVSDMAGVTMLSPDGLPSGHHEVRVMRVMSSSNGEAPEIIQENVTGGGMDAPRVMMLGGPHGLDHIDFASLESLKGLDPKVREKVIAALHEILASPRVVTVKVNTDTPAPRAQ